MLTSEIRENNIDQMRRKKFPPFTRFTLEIMNNAMFNVIKIHNDEGNKYEIFSKLIEISGFKSLKTDKYENIISYIYYVNDDKLTFEIVNDIHKKEILKTFYKISVSLTIDNEIIIITTMNYENLHYMLQEII